MAVTHGAWSAFPVPASPDELTPDWFSVVLGDLFREPVRSVELERLGGLSSLVYRARLTFGAPNRGGPESVVVKLPLPSMMGEFQGSGYEREIGFYSDLAPQCPIRVPRLHLAAIDDPAGTCVLVLEDFPHYKAGDEAPVSGNLIELVVDELARLHAWWWNSAELETKAFLRTLDNFIERVEAHLAPALPRFLSRFESAIGATERRLLEGLPVTFRRLVEPLAEAPSTLVHHDLSLRNVLFADDAHQPEVVFIDWQLAQRNAGVRDLSYFVGTSVPANVDEALLVARYHRQLERHGIANYSMEQLRIDYARSVIADFGRMVMTGGPQELAPAMERIVADQLRRRSGVVAKLGLDELL